jgi:putative membrane protein
MTGYLWLKTFHLIGLICWFAGIFYLPRLFVYHSGAIDEPSKQRFKVMESKLYRFIMNPSMIVTLVFGFWMLIESWQAFSGQFWIWLKLTLVILLVGYHHYCLKIIKAFADDRELHSERFYRIFNEMPVLALIAIVILAVIKPF